MHSAVSDIRRNENDPEVHGDHGELRIEKIE